MDSSSQQSSIAISSSLGSFYLEENWDSFYDKLVSFKEQHGHCIIPDPYEEDPALAQWVSEQRIRGQEKLDEDKVAKLTALSFEWYPTKSMNQDKWLVMYDTLKKYKEEHGDCLVPQRYPDDPKLGRWVNKQRENKDNLLPERRKLLDKIGFTWMIVQREPWDKMLERLIVYKRQFGDCLVPQRYKKDPRLGGWVREQRKRQRLMSEERKQKLDVLAFTWNAKQDPNLPSNNQSHQLGVSESSTTATNESRMVTGYFPQHATTIEYNPSVLPYNINNGGLGSIALTAGSAFQYNLAAIPAATNTVASAAGLPLSLPQIPLVRIVPSYCVAPHHANVSLNMNNDGGLGIVALPSQQQSSAGAPISTSIPQNLLGTTIGPVVPVMNQLAASAAMIPSFQAQSALAQCNRVVTNPQGQTADHQVGPLSMYHSQMLQARGLPPFVQFPQQHLMVPSVPVAPGVSGLRNDQPGTKSSCRVTPT